MTRDRRLGRGLAALLSDPAPAESADHPRIHEPDSRADDSNASTPAATGTGDEQEPIDRLLDVDQIVENPFQPRRDFGEDEIESLAASLAEHDMLQPVLVRQHEGRWQLISGERRWRAAKRAGWKQIPVRVKQADDRLVAELAIVENLQRKDLNPIEKALSFQRYLQEHGCTQDELGKRLKIDRSTIANLLRLLELPEPVQVALQAGKLSAGHARALLPLGDPTEQCDCASRIQAEGLSVRATERLVQELVSVDQPTTVAISNGKPKRSRTQTGQVGSMETELRRALGTRVDIQAGSRGRGKFVIHFKNHEEFERLLHYLTDDSVTSSTATG